MMLSLLLYRLPSGSSGHPDPELHKLVRSGRYHFTSPHLASMSAAVPVENSIILDLTPSYGALIIGVVISGVIFGISCTQA